MKELLAVVLLLVSGTVAEPPAPYAPSGWRPSGPSFDFPQQQPPQKQQYLPPVDPRNPLPPTSYGTPEEDVSVQGLPPQQEQLPLFQSSPISGQQYAGPGFNTDLRNLDKSYQQLQYQQQQERYRDYQRQKQLEAAQNAPNGNRLPLPQDPRQFVRTTTTTTTTEASTTPVASTTEIDLNQGEILNSDDKAAKLRNGKTSVEVTKQRVQEYPGEFFLSSLAQIQLQPQFVRLQPLSGAYIQPQSAPQKQVAGFDAASHFSALPSVLAQQQAQNLQPQYQSPELLVQNDQQAVLVQQSYQPYQPQVQTQLQPEPVVLQAPAQFQPNFYAQPNSDAVAVQQPVPQYQPANSYQPVLQQNPDAVAVQPQYQPQQLGFTQLQAQRVIYQPQQNQFLQPQFVQPQHPSLIPSEEKEEDVDTENEDKDKEGQEDRNSQQQLYQQPIIVQPQAQYQPQQFPTQLIQSQDQAQFYQPQTQYLQPQTQYLQPQVQFAQPQGQFVQPQGQFAQPQGQFAQPEAQFIQPQAQYQPQPQFQSQVPQGQFVQPQNQYLQPQDQYSIQPQGQFVQGPLPQGQIFQGQYAQQQFQGQDALQSGLDINQEGNNIDQKEDTESEPEGATAVATAFGTRTQPRVQPQYGVPFPVPRVQASPSSTTESAVEEVTENGPAVAQATAVADGERRKSARLRSRRIRPVYAVDRSGRLVLAEA